MDLRKWIFGVFFFLLLVVLGEVFYLFLVSGKQDLVTPKAILENLITSRKTIALASEYPGYEIYFKDEKKFRKYLDHVRFWEKNKGKNELRIILTSVPQAKYQFFEEQASEPWFSVSYNEADSPTFEIKVHIGAKFLEREDANLTVTNLVLFSLYVRSGSHIPKAEVAPFEEFYTSWREFAEEQDLVLIGIRAK